MLLLFNLLLFNLLFQYILSSCVNVNIIMTDTYGDGWNGNKLCITDDCSIQSELTSGYFGIQTVCLEPGTYTPSCCGGFYPYETHWSLVGLDVGGVCCADNPTLTIPDSCTMVAISLHGASWSDITFCFDEDENICVPYSNEKYVKLMCLPDGYYNPTCSVSSYNPSLSWSIPQYGITGNCEENTNLPITVDSSVAPFCTLIYVMMIAPDLNGWSGFQLCFDDSCSYSLTLSDTNSAIDVLCLPDGIYYIQCDCNGGVISGLNWKILNNGMWGTCCSYNSYITPLTIGEKFPTVLPTPSPTFYYSKSPTISTSTHSSSLPLLALLSIPLVFSFIFFISRRFMTLSKVAAQGANKMNNSQAIQTIQSNFQNVTPSVPNVPTNYQIGQNFNNSVYPASHIQMNDLPIAKPISTTISYPQNNLSPPAYGSNPNNPNTSTDTTHNNNNNNYNYNYNYNSANYGPGPSYNTNYTPVSIPVSNSGYNPSYPNNTMIPNSRNTIVYPMTYPQNQPPAYSY